MSNPEGLAIARQLIAQEAQLQTGFLDLGKLGLTDLPDEVHQLTHLRGLNLGRWYFDKTGGFQLQPLTGMVAFLTLCVPSSQCESSPTRYKQNIVIFRLLLLIWHLTCSCIQ